MFGFDFSGQTILIAGAGCAAGSSMAAQFAAAKARVIVMDRDEEAVIEIAAKAPQRIEPLRLDVMREDHCVHLGQIWADEPIALLLHLQPLRHAERPDRALTSIVRLSRALLPGLQAGRAGVVYLFQEHPGDADVEALAAAFRALAPKMQARLDARGVMVNSLQLPTDAGEAAWRRVVDVLSCLSVREGPAVGGAILPLLPRSD